MATVVSACILHNPHGHRAAVRKLRRDSTQLPVSAPCCSATHLKAPSSSTKFGMVTKSANDQLSPEAIRGEVSLSPWAPLTRIPRHFNNIELAAGATIALAVVVALVRALRLAAKKPVRALKLATSEPVQIHGGESVQSDRQNTPSKIGDDANAALSDKPIIAYRVASLSEERNFPSLQELHNTGSPKQPQGALWAGDNTKSLRPNAVNFGDFTAAENSVALALLAEPRESPFSGNHPGESACNFHAPSPSRGPVRSCPEEMEVIPRALAVGSSSWDRPPIEDEVIGTFCPTENPLSDSITEVSCEDDEDGLAVNGSGFEHLSEEEADTASIVSSPLIDADSPLQPSYLGSDVGSQPSPIMEPLNMNVNAKQELQSPLNRDRTIQVAVPIIAIGAGALGAVMGVEGAMEMVGVVATASFVTYELLWAQTRKRLWEDLESVTDHKKFMSFLKSRDIIKHF